jgi:DNA repair photolyase
VAGNPPNRFDRLHLEHDPESGDPEELAVSPGTEYLQVRSRSALSSNDSPDLPFDYSVNPYSGCEHGCAYCYARPTHEYWGFSAGLDFETRILVKQDVPELLRKELSSRRWKPAVINFSGVTDCYQPVEKRLQLTRRCVEVLLEFRNPFFIITKNRLVVRDGDLLAEAARLGLVAVLLSVTTLDGELSGKLEPRASRPGARLEAVSALAGLGVPVGVNAAPLLPGLTDHELPAILEAGVQAGAKFAHYSVARLPGAVEGVFTEWLERHAPGHKDKVLRRIRETQGGKASSSKFGERFRGQGIHAETLRALFESTRRRLNLDAGRPQLRTDLFQRPNRMSHPGPDVDFFGVPSEVPD